MIRDDVKKLIAKGYAVVPVPPRLKGPKIPGWQSKTFTSEHFSPNDNVGIIVGARSNGLVDVDMDCDEAVALAPFFLPTTDMWHGRTSRPRSHAWYILTDAPETSIQLRDSADKMLVELRSGGTEKGFQTLVPPSVHPSEEALSWDGEEPSTLTLAELEPAVKRLAAASMLARVFPANGRHKFCLALAGVLLRSGMTVKEAQAFIFAVCKVGGSSDPQARSEVVHTTAAKLAAGEQVTGLPTLQGLIASDPARGIFPQDVISRLAEFITLPQEQERTYSEAGIAEAFIAHTKGRALWIPERKKWALFTDNLGWQIGDPTWQVVSFLRDLREDFNKKAKEGNEAAEALAKRMLSYETGARIKSVEGLARTLATSPLTEWDAEALTMVVGNGVIDLTTTSHGPFTPAARSLRRSTVTHLADAKAPRWHAFLKQILPDDETRDFVQVFIGYCLTGRMDEQVMAIFYGTGANGKSTFLEVLRHVFGTYSTNAEASTFIQKQAGGIPNDLAALAGARFVTSAEVGSGAHLAEALIKRATGGDPITARFLNAEFFEYNPTFKLLMSSNSRPIIKGLDKGIWRRIRLVPFTVSIPEEAQDGALKDKLLLELPGILNWALEGCKAWQQAGLPFPPAMKDAVQGYQADMDGFSEFFEESCTFSEGAFSSTKELYQAYTQWSLLSGDGKPVTKSTFLDVLAHKNLVSSRQHNQRGWLGISLGKKTLKNVP